MSNTYKSTNQQVWGEGGTGYAGELAQADAEKDRIKNDPTRGQAYTQSELEKIYNSQNITGGYDTKTQRTEKAGDSGADEALMMDSDYQLVQNYKAEWNRLNDLAKQTDDPVLKQQLLAQRDQANTDANRLRLRYGYSGGADGSMYLTAGQLGVAETPSGQTGGNLSGSFPGVSSQSGSSSDLQSLLKAWQDAALQQSNGQVDYAVAKAVADLERALEDAQPQFKEQAESADINARQAMDNSALYAELRGDKGGIGQEQYNAIQNTQAQNHLAVQQAQTKLATDTQRQIADLRAQGEFEKADAALEITQTYLAQLISLEQWAKEYNLSVQQFEASLQQWEAEYNMALQQLQISQNQWQAEFDAAQNQWQSEFGYTQQLNQQNQLSDMGTALLSAGIPLTDEQLKAMGITGEQASQLLLQQQLAAAQKNNTTTKKSAAYDDALKTAKAKGNPQAADKYLGNLVSSGVLPSEEADYIYRVVLGYEYITPSKNPNAMTPDLKN